VPVSSRLPTSDRATCPPAGGTCADESAHLAAWLQRTREAERAALARELHDELGAILTAARLDVAWIAAQPQCQDPEVAQRLGALQRVLAQGIGLKRRIVEDLHPTVLTHLGLVPALEQLLESNRQRFQGRLAVSLDAAVALDGEPALALYRIVQEALTNIHKYAGARNVAVRLTRSRGRVELAVEDDGTGFDPAAVGCGHHGLAGMRHRMLAVGGRLDVVSAPGSGTVIRATVPTRAAAAGTRIDPRPEPARIELSSARRRAGRQPARHADVPSLHG
jgi:signal transduction histidine kinase